MECTLQLTDCCNFKCNYCYQRNDKKSISFNSNVLQNSLEFIVSNNMEGSKVYLTFLGGEPLLKKDLIYETLETIESKYSKYSDLFKYNITTNCSLLDDVLITLFKNNNFYIRASIDGDKATHNLNRKSRFLEKGSEIAYVKSQQFIQDL